MIDYIAGLQIALMLNIALFRELELEDFLKRVVSFKVRRTMSLDIYGK
jgi:hypothetical protein